MLISSYKIFVNTKYTEKIISPSHVQSALEKCPRLVEIKHNTNIGLKLNEYSYTHYRNFHINTWFL